ncbi:MAG: hypothetical protein RR267_02385 [Erysipelotrichaceae bacterium]
MMQKNNDEKEIYSSEDEDLLNMIREYEQDEKKEQEEYVDYGAKKPNDLSSAFDTYETQNTNNYEDTVNESALKAASGNTRGYDDDKTLTILKSNRSQPVVEKEEEPVHDFVEEEPIQPRKNGKNKKDKKKGKMSEDKVNKIITGVIIGIVVVIFIGVGVFLWDMFGPKGSDEPVKDDPQVETPIKKPSKPNKKPTKPTVEEPTKPDYTAQINALKQKIATEQGKIREVEPEIGKATKARDDAKALVDNKQGEINYLTIEIDKLDPNVEADKPAYEEKNNEKNKKMKEKEGLVEALNAAQGVLDAQNAIKTNSEQAIAGFQAQIDGYPKN